MKINFAGPRLPRSGTVVLPVGDERKLLPSAARLDEESGGALSRAMGSSRFKGRGDETLSVLAPAKLEFSRVLLYGIGKDGGGERGAWQNRGGQIVAQLNSAGDKTAAIALDHSGDDTTMAADVAYGARLRSYRFDKYRTKEKPEQKPSLEELTILVEEPAAAKRAFQPLEKIAEAVFFSRDIISEPANVIYPETLAEARALGREARRRGRGARREADEEARHERAPGRGAGQRPSAAPRRHAMEGQSQGQEPGAHRLHRQGRDLRHRRHLDQARRRHGGHEVGHGRGRRGDRPDARARRRARPRSTPSASSAWSRTCRRARRSARATS